MNFFAAGYGRFKITVLSFLSWAKMEISKLSFLNFVYIMATGMILLARISYAKTLHSGNTTLC
jgi:hypothetical protein